MKPLKNTFLVAITVIAFAGLNTHVYGQATDVVCSGCINPSDIAAKAVTSGKLGNGSVTTEKIAPGAVTSAKFNDGAVTNAKISNSAVTTDKLAVGAVTTNKIQLQAVTRSKLRVNAVSTGKIEDGAVTAAKLAPDALFSPIGGDGSAGDLVISGNVDWRGSPPLNPNFANVTIEGGGNLVVPAGTTISCSGNFLNIGLLQVFDGPSNNATSFATGGGGTMGYSSVAHSGDTPRAANGSDWHNDSVANTQALSGGFGGLGISRATVVTSIKRFRFGGGSGGGILSGANGGGLIIVKCGGPVTNSGTITTDGAAGNIATGGGGGGIVVLASATSVDNSNGTINARGGTGGSEQADCCAPGGGGGGGIVVSIAPTINNSGGVIDVTGGTGVTATGTPTVVARTAGGGGGGSGGIGGSGGGGGGTNTSSALGSSGYSLEILANPATIL